MLGTRRTLPLLSAVHRPRPRSVVLAELDQPDFLALAAESVQLKTSKDGAAGGGVGDR